MTGFALAWITELITAAKVISGTITSSSSLIPKASNAKWSAAVPLLTAKECMSSWSLLNDLSKFLTYSPWDDIQPDLMHLVTFRSSSFPKNGSWIGIKLLLLILDWLNFLSVNSICLFNNKGLFL